MSETGLHVRVDEGSGPPLVLLHGWSCHGGFFQPQIEALSGRAHVLVPDLPGHGETGSRLPLTIEAAADAVADLIENRNLSDVTLCGWSMGAHVAYSYAERHGTERLRQIVAIDMSPKVLNAPDWPNGSLGGLDAKRNIHVLEAMVPDWPKLAPKVAERIFARGLVTDPELLAFAKQEIGKADPDLLRPMWTSLTAQDFRPFLERLDIPLHLAFGARSALYGAGVHDWHAAHVPDVSLRIFDRSGHCPHLEEADAFNTWLTDLLGKAGQDGEVATSART
ncbi:alpha/beta fold hydrolase [Roseibium aggregatum]|uniref:Alpha/beta hydrolase n=1 Tax=Roseibium aggregatum TaxID=187304 RepID=A0A926P229_9HYPH|nr:alpha/beta hydrolase [Roseibium aggregatum]MBD1548596.1 alpha/beta hydrolase [Roseibium aggregatum]